MEVDSTLAPSRKRPLSPSEHDGQTNLDHHATVSSGEIEEEPAGGAKRIKLANGEAERVGVPEFVVEPVEVDAEKANGIPKRISRVPTVGQTKRYLAAQTHPIIIPSYATWFKFDSIHQIESKAMPEFFKGRNRSKTPQIYKDYRDFMINTYRLNPTEYLTVTAVRRNLCGDVCAIMRVHAFLEQWGLINYQIDPSTRPSTLVPPFTGHFRVLIDTPRGLAPQLLHPGTSTEPTLPQVVPGKKTDEIARTIGTTPTLELTKSIFQHRSGGKDAVKLSEEEAKEGAKEVLKAEGEEFEGGQEKLVYQCDSCGVECGRVRYRSIGGKRKDEDETVTGTEEETTVCHSCYLSARFPMNLSNGDFIKVVTDPSDSLANFDSKDDWKDEETLRLLEALEMYADASTDPNTDAWDNVARHVGTRSRTQCLAHFLRLPINAPFQPPEDAKSLLTDFQHPPLTKLDNPVLSVVAFLAGLVDPETAALAAGEQRGVQGVMERLKNGLTKRRKEEEKKEEESEKKDGEKEDNDVEMDTEKEDPADHPPKPSPPPATMTNGNTDDHSNGVQTKSNKDLALLSLKTATTKASGLFLQEDLALQKKVLSVVEGLTSKLEMKVKNFERFEQVLEYEKRRVESMKREVEAERTELGRMRAELARKSGRLQEEQQRLELSRKALESQRDRTKEAYQLQLQGQSAPQPAQNTEDEIMKLLSEATNAADGGGERNEISLNLDGLRAEDFLKDFAGLDAGQVQEMPIDSNGTGAEGSVAVDAMMSLAEGNGTDQVNFDDFVNL
ncbi:SWIRM-domain-containing protein [Atractiella rhizophila]|nr:SWIRM-domain-containing protein [Atractiella rhizophila]